MAFLRNRSRRFQFQSISSAVPENNRVRVKSSLLVVLDHILPEHKPEKQTLRGRQRYFTGHPKSKL
jgi:hypothetical protein